MTLKQLFSYASLTEIDPSFCNQLGIIDFKPDTTDAKYKKLYNSFT